MQFTYEGRKGKLRTASQPPSLCWSGWHLCFQQKEWCDHLSPGPWIWHEWYVYVNIQFSSVQSLSRVRLFVTPWIAARQASLSITNSQSSPKLMSIESVMPSNHLIFCRPLLLLPSIFPSIRVFSNESALRIRWPKYIGVSASTSVLPMNTQDWSALGWYQHLDN